MNRLFSPTFIALLPLILQAPLFAATLPSSDTLFSHPELTYTQYIDSLLPFSDRYTTEYIVKAVDIKKELLPLMTPESKENYEITYEYQDSAHKKHSAKIFKHVLDAMISSVIKLGVTYSSAYYIDKKQLSPDENKHSIELDRIEGQMEAFRHKVLVFVDQAAREALAQRPSLPRPINSQAPQHEQQHEQQTPQANRDALSSPKTPEPIQHIAPTPAPLPVPIAVPIPAPVQNTPAIQPKQDNKPIAQPIPAVKNLPKNRAQMRRLQATGRAKLAQQRRAQLGRAQLAARKRAQGKKQIKRQVRRRS